MNKPHAIGRIFAAALTLSLSCTEGHAGGYKRRCKIRPR